MTLNSTDKLRLLRFSEPDLGAVRLAINQSWSQGIQHEESYYGAWEYKLKGNPWYGAGDEAIPSRILTTAIFAALYNQGWSLAQNSDLSKAEHDKDTMFFRKFSALPPCHWSSISFNEFDKIRLIRGPPELIQAVGQLLRPLTQEVKEKEAGTTQWKLKGTPWKASRGETVTSRVLVLDLISLLDHHGWQVYASIDQSVRTALLDSYRKCSSVFARCRRTSRSLVDWTAGFYVVGKTGSWGCPSILVRNTFGEYFEVVNSLWPRSEP